MNDEELRRRVHHAAELHGVSAADVVADVEGEKDIDEPKSAPRWDKRVAWVVSLIVVGAMVGVAIVGLMKLVNDPAVSSQELTLKSKQASLVPTPEPNSHLSGQLIEMDYPHIFNRVGNNKNVHFALEQFHLTASQDYKWSAEVTVREMESDNLYDDGSYRLRAVSPTEYRPEKVGATGAVVMVKADRSERTLFWINNKKLVTVALTYSGGSSELEKHMAVMTKSLRWRR